MAYFDDLRAAFDRAAARSGLVERSLDLAGRSVDVRFAGALAERQFGRALAHRMVEADRSPELTVFVFDSESTGVPPPPAPWGPADVRERGVIEPLSDDDSHFVYQVVTGQLSALDRSVREAVVWVRSCDALPMSERAAPLWRLLHQWLAERGLFLVHGASVGLADGGVLFAGAGGAGKSGSTLACLPSLLGIAGDDYVLVEVGERPRVHSVYNSAKVFPSDVVRMPFLEAMLDADQVSVAGKSVLFLHEHAPEALRSGYELRAVLTPRVMPIARAVAEPTSSATALRALAPSSVLLAPGTAGQAFPALAALTRRLPCFELQVGSDVASIPAAVLDVVGLVGDDRQRTA